MRASQRTASLITLIITGTWHKHLEDRARRNRTVCASFFHVNFSITTLFTSKFLFNFPYESFVKFVLSSQNKRVVNG